MMLTPSNQDKIFAIKRKALVDELRAKGIKNEAVLKAIGTVLRHKFIDSGFHHRAYEDSALPIALKQTISQPYTVARQTELLDIKSGDKILEVGTGSGYQAAVLCEMKAQVFSVERHDELYRKTQKLLREMGYRVEQKCGDGTLGWSAYGPYSGIVVTAGAPVVPEALTKQLAIGGRLIIPVGDDKTQSMLKIVRTGEDSFTEESFSDFKFVPLIGKEGWSE
jgi:protein-L-isoaspartate(D-aspartate) O-methyltransferase